MSNSMFGNSIFNGGNQNAMDQMKQQLEMQMAQYQKMQQAQNVQQNAGALDQLKSVLSELSQDEQQQLSKLPEFLNCRNIYESGFIDFLGSKFAGEYVQTPVGKQAVENLIESSKIAVKKIKETSKERNKKLEAMAALIESDPDIQKKIQEQLNK